MAISLANKDNLLGLIGRVCGEVGLVAPSAVIGNADLQVTQLLALMRREGREQFSMGTPIDGWQVLRQEYLFTLQSTGVLTGATVTQGSSIVTLGSVPATPPQAGWTISVSAGSNGGLFPNPTKVLSMIDSTHVQLDQPATVGASNTSLAFGQDTYALPADYDHSIPQTFWDRGFRWQLLGPMSPQEWQVLKSGISPTGPRRRFRLMDGNFVVDPIPGDVNQLVFEYYSAYWVVDQASAPKAGFTVDTDYFALDDDAMVLGTIWRFRRAKGLDYDEEKDMWEKRVDLVKARQAAERVLPLNAVSGDVRLLSGQNVPDTGFGS